MGKPGGMALLDLLELVAREQPRLLEVVLVRIEDPASLASDLGLAEGQLRAELLRATKRLDALEAASIAGQRRASPMAEVTSEPVSPFLMALCRARSRNTAGARQQQLGGLETLLRRSVRSP